MRAKRGIFSKLALGLIFIFWLVIIAVGYFSHHHVAVLDPAGSIAHRERSLMFLAIGLCAIVVIPVFSLAIGVAWRYREGNKKRSVKYSPNWDGSRWIEGVWWAVPLAIIATLAVVTWRTSYSLDPYKALAADQSSLNVQVVAMDWKWLFIYPQQNIASVNWLELPLNRPVNFHVTSTSVMNSFWIPDLGSQIYAMPGMDTQVNLIASKTGSYRGSSANISGRGFASMNFTVLAVSGKTFESWAVATKQNHPPLGPSQYSLLAAPGANYPISFYSSVEPGLYYQIVNQYQASGAHVHGGHGE